MREPGIEPAGLRSGQVADAAGVNVQTLRYYERRGLLAEPERSLGGHRLYPTEAVAVLRVIKAAQRLGFTLGEVAELLDAGRRGPGARPDAGLPAHARAKLAEVEEKIAALHVIRDALIAAVDAGCDDLVACAASPCCPVPFGEPPPFVEIASLTGESDMPHALSEAGDTGDERRWRADGGGA